jgi:hypothetical protein
MRDAFHAAATTRAGNSPLYQARAVKLAADIGIGAVSDIF